MNAILLNNKTRNLILLLTAILIIWLVSFHAFDDAASSALLHMKYAFTDKSGLTVSLKSVDPHVRSITMDDQNHLLLEIQVRKPDGTAGRDMEINLKAVIQGAANSAGTERETADQGNGANQEAASTGSFVPAAGFTDSTGCFHTIYTPPGKPSYNPQSNSTPDSVLITARLSGTNRCISIRIGLVPVPIILIHGYKAKPDIFSGISAYLKKQGFTALAFDYATENGVADSAIALSSFLKKTGSKFASAGIQVNRFDLIAHSMGGLVARYYTCSSEYPQKSDVRKLIFLSVPQNGSPFATLGLKYYNDRGIHDLSPESSLYSKVFPSMINRGLNPVIQTGNLVGLHDEVVGLDSTSLEFWNIRSELFDLGESNFTLEKLMNGQILQAANHKLILYNKKVYDRILQMLKSDIPYPSTK